MGHIITKKRIDGLYSKICYRCGGLHISNDKDLPKENLRKEAERIAKGLYNGTIKSGTIDPTLTTLVAEELRQAVIEGFGKDTPELDYVSPDFKMLQSLERDVFHFSAAKNYQQLKSMSLALRDENGNLRTFANFRNEAMKISDTYVGAWLRTEYDTAIGTAQMAGKWVDIEANKSIAPLLKYVTVGDAKVRRTHQVLDGIIRPVDDSFWETYYPPNGWRCRCDVEQMLSGTITPLENVTTPDDIPRMFRVNMGKRGLAFPPDHPYYIGVPEVVLKAGEALQKEAKLNKRRAEYNALSKSEYPSSFRKFFDETGGYYATHKDHMANARVQNLQTASLLAEKGEAVVLQNERTAGKSFDATRNSKGWEFKQIGKAKNIVNAVTKQIKRASVQADKLLIHFRQPAIIIDIENGLQLGAKNWDKKGKIKRFDILFDDGRIFSYTRKQLLKK